MSTTTNTGTLRSTKAIAKIAILGALAAVIMVLEFPLPFAPSFYKFDFSEVPVLIGGFALGPMAAVWIEAVKVMLNFLINGTTTMGVGELANFLIGCGLSVPAAIIYRKSKTRKNALIGMLVGTVCMTIMGVVLNYLVLIPAYVSIAHFPLDAIIAMGTAINSVIHDTFTLVLICVTPFNLLKGIAVSAITCVLYKHVSPLLHR